METPQWTPNNELLTKIVNLMGGLTNPNTEHQRKIYSEIEALCMHLDFTNYLATIISAPTLSVMQRRTAAVLLKSLLERNQSIIDQPFFNYTKTQLAISLQDAPSGLAKITGNAVVTILRLKGFPAWPDILKLINTLIKTNKPEVIQNAVSCLEKICEDINVIYQVKREDFEALVPSLIEIAKNKALPDQTRGSSIHSLAFSYASMGSGAFAKYLPAVVPMMMECMQEAITGGKLNKSVEKNLCGLSILLLKDKKEGILSIYRELFAYHLKSLGSPDYDVAFAACDFWQVYLRTNWQDDYEEQKWQILGEALPQLIPQLVSVMKYSAADLAGIIKDAATDIKYTESEDILKPGEDEGAEEEEGEQADGIYETSTLRRCAAYTLDELARTYRDRVFAIISPLIDKLLAQESWVLKESAIYALGVISVGCEDAIQPHLLGLIEYLFGLLAHPEPFLRNISCWTLSRYSSSFFSLDPTSEKHLFQRYLQHLMAKVTDSDSLVQEAACSSAISLMDSVPEKMLPYAYEILKVFISVIKTYKGPALAGLYDAIGKLVENVYQEKIQKDEQSLTLLLPPLFDQWNLLKDTDRILCPLLECFQSIITAMGPVFERWAAPVLERSLRIMGTMIPLVEEDIKHIREKTPMVDKEFIIRAIDVIGSLCCSIGNKIEPHLAKMADVPANIFIAACESGDMQVRQYGCALLGDVVKVAKGYLMQYLSRIIPLLLSYLNCDAKEISIELSICNNCCWTIGEIIMAYPAVVPQFANQCTEYLVKLLQADVLRRSITQNAAITIGRLGLYAAREVSPHLEGILKGWCLALRVLKDIPEKQQAFKGMCHVIVNNPAGALKDFPYFCDAVAEYRNPGEELEVMLKTVLIGFKETLGAQWPNYYAQFPEDLRKQLTARFGL